MKFHILPQAHHISLSMASLWAPKGEPKRSGTWTGMFTAPTWSRLKCSAMGDKCSAFTYAMGHLEFQSQSSKGYN